MTKVRMNWTSFYEYQNELDGDGADVFSFNATFFYLALV